MPRTLFATLALIVFATAVLRVAGVTNFALDAKRTRYAHALGGPGAKHNCMTCYVISAHLASRGAKNIYERGHYKSPKAPTKYHEEIGESFTIDHYPYPPQFLLLPKAFLLFSNSFFTIRTGWFFLTLVVLALAVIASGVYAGGLDRNLALLFLPALFASQAVVMTLQIGNVQLLLLAACVLAMLCFAGEGRVRNALGGALLAFAIVTKIWPGVLLFYHLCGKRWRPLAWTAGWLAVYSGLTLAVFGTAVFGDFINYQLPRLINGEAFGFMANAKQPLASNMSVNGLPHKLHFLGVIADKPPLLTPWVVWSLTGFALALVAFAGWRSRDMSHATRSPGRRLWQVRTWLAVLALVSLRSPFLPFTYGIVAPLWLTLFLLPGRGRVGTLVLSLVIVGFALPHWTEVNGRAWHTSIATAVTIVLASWALLAPPPAEQKAAKARSSDDSLGRGQAALA